MQLLPGVWVPNAEALRRIPEQVLQVGGSLALRPGVRISFPNGRELVPVSDVSVDIRPPGWLPIVEVGRAPCATSSMWPPSRA